jgi:hypothetical protein
MNTGSSGHGPRCVICQRFFTPDPRQGDRQKLCGRKECRRQYKSQWQRDEYARNAKFRGKVTERVRRWRWNHPAYWRSADAASGVDPPLVASLQQVSDTVVRLEHAVNGLASHATGCRNREELHEVLSRCVERGRQVLQQGLSL